MCRYNHRAGNNFRRGGWGVFEENKEADFWKVLGVICELAQEDLHLYCDIMLLKTAEKVFESGKREAHLKEDEMAEYPYVLVLKKLRDFMKHIQTAGVPPKVTLNYIKAAGFKSSNDERIPVVLRFIGFIDSAGTPTEAYKKYRDKAKAPIVLGNAIREAYAELFKMYPDAYQKDSEALRNFFSGYTTAGERVLSAIVSTFQTLCSDASFEIPEAVHKEPTAPTPPPPAVSKTLGIQSLTINLQLTLPETTNSKVYEEIFKAMRTYLLGSTE